MALLLSNTITLLVLALAFYLMIKFAKRFQKIDFIFGTLLTLFSGFYKTINPDHYAELGFPVSYVQVYNFDISPNFNYNFITFAFNAFIWTILIKIFRYITLKIRTANQKNSQNK